MGQKKNEGWREGKRRAKEERERVAILLVSFFGGSVGLGAKGIEGEDLGWGAESNRVGLRLR